MTIRGNVGPRMRMLRKQSGMSVRALAARAGITPAMISCVENGKASPSLVTLEKVLSALGTELVAFFGAEQKAPRGPVFPRESMRLVADDERSCKILFPKTGVIGVEMMDEIIQRGTRKPAFVKLTCDIAGYLLSGLLTLEVKGDGATELRPGDAFYIPAGQEHRGFSKGKEPTRLITVLTTKRSPLARGKRADDTPGAGRARG